jgi:hypothetical protein
MGQIGEAQVKTQPRKHENKEKNPYQGGQGKYNNQDGDQRPKFKPNNNKTNYVQTDGNYPKDNLIKITFKPDNNRKNEELPKYTESKDNFSKPTFKQDTNKKNEELYKYKQSDNKNEKTEKTSKFELFI